MTKLSLVGGFKSHVPGPSAVLRDGDHCCQLQEAGVWGVQGLGFCSAPSLMFFPVRNFRKAALGVTTVPSTMTRRSPQEYYTLWCQLPGPLARKLQFIGGGFVKCVLPGRVVHKRNWDSKFSGGRLWQSLLLRPLAACARSCRQPRVPSANCDS